MKEKQHLRMDIVCYSGSDCLSGDSECLFLLKEDNNEVYVDNCPLQQHQIDALRFLFKQYHKKSPGVIINFPSSCGKTATTALFLNAVTNMLKNPILILCKDDTEKEYWKNILLKWSTFVEDELAVESLNPFVKGKKVFLNTLNSLTSHLRRRWSVVVIKENVDLVKLKFESDFKIYITSTDIKKDSSLLSAVYKWLYSKPKFNILDFVTKDKHHMERFRKSVQLDAILEDVAIRRYINLKPFQFTEKTSDITEIEIGAKPKAKPKSAKNKDATGTKIKRSKKPTTEENKESKNNDAANEKPDENILLTNEITNRNDVLLNKCNQSNNLNNEKRKSENVSNKDNPVINDILLYTANNCETISSKNISSDDQASFKLDIGSIIVFDDEENSRKEYKFDESLHLDADFKVNQNEIKGSDENDLLQKHITHDNETNTNDSQVYLKEMNDLEETQDSISEALNMNNDSNVNSEARLDNVKVEINDDSNITNVTMLKGERSTATEEWNENEMISVENDDESKNYVNISNKRKSDESDKGLDERISSMEKEMLKKFKGSFLDSLF